MAIAIIGGGLSGTLTAIQLLNNATKRGSIYLIEQDRYRMNRGIAYSSQLAFQPLNVPASSMGLFPEKPHDFFEWLSAVQHRYSKHLHKPVSLNDFIPRFIFGDYLKARLQEAEAHAPDGVKLIKIYDEAVTITKHAATFKIKFRSYAPIEAAKVVLALGNFPPANLPLRDTSFYNSVHYVASPWSAKGLANLAPDASVLLIGSSLTMVDLVGSLHAQGHQGSIYVVSRHGLLPQPIDPNTIPYLKPNLHLNLTGSVLAFSRSLKKEIQEAEAKGYTWRSVLDALRSDIPAIWQSFTLQEKKQFLRHLRPYWETHRHRMPPNSAALLEKLKQQGQLKIIAASIVDLQAAGEIATVTIKRRKKTETEKLTVNRVINCTGPQCDFTKIRMPLVAQLLKDGMIQPDDLRLGLLTAADGTLVNAENIPVEGLYTLGPPRKALLYESTALQEIRQQASELAQKLLQETGSYKENLV